MTESQLSLKQNRELILQKLNITDFEKHKNNLDVHTSSNEKRIIETHIANTEIHITPFEKSNINKISEKVNITDFNEHLADINVHLKPTDRTNLDEISKLKETVDFLSNKLNNHITESSHGTGGPGTSSLILASGVGIFNNAEGTIITHNLNLLNYGVTITPKGNTLGNVGEISVSTSPNTFMVYNSGNSVTEFFYVVYKLTLV